MDAKTVTIEAAGRVLKAESYALQDGHIFFRLLNGDRSEIPITDDLRIDKRFVLIAFQSHYGESAQRQRVEAEAQPDPRRKQSISITTRLDYGNCGR